MRKHMLSLFLVAGLFGWLDLWNYFFQYGTSAQETTVITEQSAGTAPTTEFSIGPGGDVQCPMCGGGSGGGGLPRPRPPSRPR